MLREDNLMIGLAIGVTLPVLAYLGITSLFELLETMGVSNPVGNPYTFRERTSALISVCFNLIPFKIFSNMRNEATMRGILLATGIYAVGWFFIYGSQLLEQ